MTASLFDFRDIDLMAKLSREGGGGGLTSQELAETLGLKSDHAVQAIGIRSGWMRRFGFFAFDEERRLWTLSRGGERIVQAHEQAPHVDALAQVSDEALVDVMAHVTSRYRHGDMLTATLLRREFAFGTSPRSAAYRTGRRRRR